MELKRRELLIALPSVGAIAAVTRKNPLVFAANISDKEIPDYLKGKALWTFSDEAERWANDRGIKGTRVRPEDQQFVLGLLKRGNM